MTDCRGVRAGDFTLEWRHKIQVVRVQLDIFEKKIIEIVLQNFYASQNPSRFRESSTCKKITDVFKLELQASTCCEQF